MPTLLTQPPLALYLLLGLSVLVAVGVWLRSRKRWVLLVLLVAVFLLIGLFTTDRLYASPQEQAVAAVQAMAASVERKDWNAFKSHLSAKFNTNAMNRDQLTKLFETAAERYNLRAIAWEFSTDDLPPPTATQLSLRFDGKVSASSGEQAPMHFVATFQLEDNKYKMLNFVPFNFVQKKVPEAFPSGVP